MVCILHKLLEELSHAWISKLLPAILEGRRVNCGRKRSNFSLPPNPKGERKQEERTAGLWPVVGCSSPAFAWLCPPLPLVLAPLHQTRSPPLHTSWPV